MTCSGFPVFGSAADLAKSPWGAYYKLVYGTIPNDGYPVDTGQTWMLYQDAIVAAKVLLTAANVCPRKGCDLYTEGDFYQPPSVSWIWHPYPYHVIAAHTWAEVLHKQDPFGDEAAGCWFIYAPGSGIWFSMGKTISFPEHQDAYTHFNVPRGTKDPNSAMSRLAARQDYDSVQFSAHVDPVNYKCDTKNTGRAGFAYMGFEIVGVKLVGAYSCGSSQGAPDVIRKGWAHSNKCVCNNKHEFLNCDGVPSKDSALDSPLLDATLLV